MTTPTPPRNRPATRQALVVLADALTAAGDAFSAAGINDELSAGESKQIAVELEQIAIKFVALAEIVTDITIGPEAARPLIERFRARLFHRNN